MQKALCWVWDGFIQEDVILNDGNNVTVNFQKIILEKTLTQGPTFIELLKHKRVLKSLTAKQTKAGYQSQTVHMT